MPDYEIKEWNESNFDINSVIWVKKVIQKIKWSLASDYIRYYAIYTEGSIYMGTDVMTYKSFDEFLGNSFFTSVKFHPQGFEVVGAKQIDNKCYPKNPEKGVQGMGLLAALYGAEKGNAFIKERMNFFGNRHFINPYGSLYEQEINSGIMDCLLVKHGFRYVDKQQ